MADYLSSPWKGMRKVGMGLGPCNRLSVQGPRGGVIIPTDDHLGCRAFYSTYPRPGRTAGSSGRQSHLVLIAIVRYRYYFLHFIDGEARVQKG